MKIKLTTWDTKWSKIIRERDKDTCQVCGNVGNLNAHHIITRSNKAVRFCLENGISLCASCHVFSHDFSAHKTPEKFKRWFMKNYSLRWEVVKRKARTHLSERDAVEEFKELISEKKVDILETEIKNLSDLYYKSMDQDLLKSLEE